MPSSRRVFRAKKSGATQTPHQHVKTLHVTHHHNKAYRIEHFLLLIISLLSLIAIALYAVQYGMLVQHESKQAASDIAKSYAQTTNQTQTIASTHGFSFSYDPLAFHASAVDSVNGELFINSELTTPRAYNEIKLSTANLVEPAAESSVTITYHTDAPRSGTPNYSELESNFISSPRELGGLSHERTATQLVDIDGTIFMYSKWASSEAAELLEGVKSSFVSYVGIVHGHVFTIEVSLGFGDTVSRDVQDIIDSLIITKQTVAQNTAPATRLSQSRSILDEFLFPSVAAADSPASTSSASQTVGSLYGPTTVKIYNVYCTDIAYNGKPYLKGACSSTAGSGFFVSSDGYIATNGHVATSNAKDIVIKDALTFAANGKQSYLLDLMKLAGISLNDPAFDDTTGVERVGIIIDKLYTDIPDKRFTKVNDATNLLVTLGQKQPDITALLTDTKKRQRYPEKPTIKQAAVVGFDYRALDGFGGFQASDVALIKINGNNYPVAPLGSIDDVTQGDELIILGYPGNASNNGIVDENESKVTLTTGKVSALKNANGSDKKLIETDTTIGHGNSGGPVFSNRATVLGLATYTADGSGDGSGVYNYIRDIQDLKDLARDNNISFNTDSKTQNIWNKAIAAFETSHYSKSLGYFADVKQLYPQHPSVDSFIATANKRIANGEDIKDFPVIPVMTAALALLAASSLAAYLIVHHRRTHNIYRHHVTRYQMAPVTKESSPQTIHYDSSRYTRMGKPSRRAKRS